MNMFRKILDLIFPERCIICGDIITPPENHIAICDHCAKGLIFLESVPTCKTCGCQLDSEGPFCLTCQTHVHYFTRAVSCFPYKGEIRRAILRYKFNNRRDYCRTFAQLLYERVRPFHEKKPFDCVVCAPMTKKGLAERGYHQTALLAGPVARELGIPFLSDAFRKTKETQKQSTLDYVARFKNVEKAFARSSSAETFKRKNILLIDDVLTTGATADALSKLLNSAGAARIMVATIAGTQKEHYEPLTEEDELMVTY